MRKHFLAGCVIILMLFLVGCGENSDENSSDTTSQNEIDTITLTVKGAPDESNNQKELAELSINSDSAFYLEDAASAIIQSKGSHIEFYTDTEIQFGEGPDDPLIAFLWYSSVIGQDKPFMQIKKMGDGFQFHFDDEVVFDDKLYVFIISNGYQGNFGNISVVVKIDGLVENQFTIDSELNLITNDLVDQSYGTSPPMVIDDNIYRTAYWVDIESSFADPALLPVIAWWPDNRHPKICAFPYDQKSGFYYEGPAVNIASSDDLNLVDDAKYIFFIVDTRIVGENME